MEFLKYLINLTDKKMCKYRVRQLCAHVYVYTYIFFFAKNFNIKLTLPQKVSLRDFIQTLNILYSSNYIY